MEEEADKQLKLKFLMFENEANNCWLNASIALIVHTKSLKSIAESSPESEMNKIIRAYNEAIATFNSSVCEQTLKSSEMLKNIQANTLKYLEKFVKFTHGKPDSAFCALLNLIYQDKSDIKDFLNVSWILRKQCASCGTHSKSEIRKPIITLSKVNAFHPEYPSSIYKCHTCKSEQEMKLIYKELPPCLIFHFEKGVGTGTKFPLAFYIRGREYQLTSIIILLKSSTNTRVNHFVTWIRNPLSNMWLECDDLNTGFASFSPIKPKFHLKDIYISIFEAFDNLGRINNEIATDQEQDVDNDNVELIDISDDENETVNTGSCIKISHDKHKIEVKSETFDYQDKSVEDFIEAKECRNEATDNTEHKVSESSVASTKVHSCPSVNNETSTIENLEICGKEKPKESEEDCNICYQKMSVSNFNLPDKLSPSKNKTEVESNKAVEKSLEARKFKAKATDNPEHSPANKLCTPTIQNLEMSSNEAKSKNSNDQNKPVKEFSAEATKYLEPKVTDTSIKNKKEKKLNILENIITDETTHEEPPLTKCRFVENIITDETTHEEPPLTKCRFVEDTSDARKTEVSKHDEKKRTEDKYATASKKRRDGSNDKYVSPKKEKSAIINDQTASTTYKQMVNMPKTQ